MILHDSTWNSHRMALHVPFYTLIIGLPANPLPTANDDWKSLRQVHLQICSHSGWFREQLISQNSLLRFCSVNGNGHMSSNYRNMHTYTKLDSLYRCQYINHFINLHYPKRAVHPFQDMAIGRSLRNNTSRKSFRPTNHDALVIEKMHGSAFQLHDALVIPIIPRRSTSWSGSYGSHLHRWNMVELLGNQVLDPMVVFGRI